MDSDIQASIIDNLDDRAKTLLVELWCRCSSQGPVTEEKRAIFALGKLRCLPDGERSNSDRNGNGRRVAGGGHGDF